MKEKSKKRIEEIAQKYIEDFYYAPKPYVELANRLHDLRLEMGFSKLDLARRAGIDRSSVAKYEAGTHLPKAKTLIKILDALYCDVEEFCKYKSRWKFDDLINRTYVATEENNIFKFKGELDDRLTHAMSYKSEGKNVPVPKDLMAVIKTNIDAAFKVLNTLNYDEEQ